MRAVFAAGLLRSGFAELTLVEGASWVPFGFSSTMHQNSTSALALGHHFGLKSSFPRVPFFKAFLGVATLCPSSGAPSCCHTVRAVPASAGWRAVQPLVGKDAQGSRTKDGALGRAGPSCAQKPPFPVLVWV